jgi:hypothetical protein
MGGYVNQKDAACLLDLERWPTVAARFLADTTSATLVHQLQFVSLLNAHRAETNPASTNFSSYHARQNSSRASSLESSERPGSVSRTCHRQPDAPVDGNAGHVALAVRLTSTRAIQPAEPSLH